MILAIIAALQTTPASPTLPEVHAAIWDDLATNAWLYTGNAIAAGSWYFGHDRDHPPTMRISDVRCIRVFSERSCRFRLIRTPDPESARPADDAAEHRRLACRATLRRERREDGTSEWRVRRIPPQEGEAHSWTTMRCRAVRSR